MAASRLRVRYWRIMYFFTGAAADFIFWELVLPRVGLRALARRTRSGRLRRIAADFRALAIRMGGLMIKVGQFLSSRLDVLPPEITQELAGLQDEVPPEKFEDIRLLAEAELNGPLSGRFRVVRRAAAGGGLAGPGAPRAPVRTAGRRPRPSATWSSRSSGRRSTS